MYFKILLMIFEDCSLIFYFVICLSVILYMDTSGVSQFMRKLCKGNASPAFVTL